MMTLGSLFDGSGGFPLAGVLNGIKPLWASETEPYPIAVTRSRLPGMKHLGDVAEVDGGEIPPVDIITFGSPCQDMSIAGKRAGMQHSEKGDSGTTRSGLFYEAVRIIREMREATDGEYPKYAVWENVPGALSSNKGEDFRRVLEAFCQIKDKAVSVPEPEKRWEGAGCIVGEGYSVAWRIFDAKFWGVPQRRRRIYLVADFGGERAGKILFEREGVRGDIAQSGETREGIAYDAQGGAGGSCGVRLMNPWETKSFVCMFMGGQGAKAGGIAYSEQVAPTLKAAPSGSNTVLDVCYCLQGNGIDRADTAGCNGKGWREDASYTLNTIDRPAVVYDARRNGDDVTVPTLTGDHQNRVTDDPSICYAKQAIGEYADKGVSSTLQARLCKNPDDLVIQSGKPPRKYIIRRLIPLECCRLQGFPDGWGAPEIKTDMTDDEAAFWERVRKTHATMNGRRYKPMAYHARLVRWYNKLHSDSAEYKMWGNGIALPCAAFVLGRIAEKEGRT